mmetsp:Transcript_68240/g.142191  ORF Transcript_68240/g.142191 Transcript_68240/m.142191 type:complete len:229 (-) Transcript_68240:1175-1861(-)|eukprot:CAMPEP_0181316202 /NCGR_PEP_ID=MMETSP1101-20121128/15771_1 /TAXON_ID=46948 /ORGANISM="Rhodomonas abbreviata, Strain Caron Lab Isolate" /LENGTH=228 /DNA_ID=CAMNT_0023423437 /DNA_START=127 /DNA_END=813 /DNA_ORIENTATION=-
MQTTEDNATAVSTAVLDAERISRLQQLTDEANAPHSKVWRKRKPRPGHYPLNYSPYKLSMTPASAIPLSRPEVKEDLMYINAGYRAEFCSTYYEEEGAPNSSPSAGESKAVTVPAVPNVIFSSGVSVSQGRLKRARNCHAGHPASILPPSNRAEEAKQLQAALKASALETSWCILQDDEHSTAGTPLITHSIVVEERSTKFEMPPKIRVNSKGHYRQFIRDFPVCGVA